VISVLMEHSWLATTSTMLNSMAEKKMSAAPCSSSSEASKSVYVFQKEFATVDRRLVDIVGTDEATTCVGIAIRNPRTGMTSIAHMDFPGVVETGLTQMLSLISERDVPLDV
ncbi:hypothetical protein M569_16741, partial [Genlisea aurea]